MVGIRSEVVGIARKMRIEVSRRAILMRITAARVVEIAVLGREAESGTAGEQCEKCLRHGGGVS